jgi:NADH-quinone oxidoreductase subunit M
MQIPILSSILLVCVATLVAILVIPAHCRAQIRIVSAVGAAITLILALALWFGYDRASGGVQFRELVPWIPQLGIDYRLGVDGFSLPLVMLNAIVFLTGVLSMWDLEVRVKEYFAFMILLVIGVFGVFTSLDLFCFFFFYEVAILPMYLLIAIWGSGRKEYAAMKLTLFLMAGSALLFPALIAIYFKSGMGTCDIMQLAAHPFPTHFQILVYPLIYLGFGVLAGMFPFHSWSPTGHAAAPTAVSMLHAGVLMKLGAFGILTIGIRLLPQGAAFWSHFFAILAGVNILYGAFVALRQTDFKYVIGFSSVSHMGIVLLGLNLATAGIDPVNAMNGAVFQMFSHGIMTALMFSTIGYVYERAHSKTIADFGGLGRQMPRAVALFIIAGLCGIGLPGMSSFWAELLVFISSLRTWPVLGALVIAGLVITALYMLRLFERAFFGPVNPRWNGLVDLSPWRLVPRIALAAVLFLFGFAPRLMLDLINQATGQFLEKL